jgi:LacI family transcriptional regulator
VCSSDLIAVIGFDDIERGEYATVPLTTIRQPTDAIGKETMKLLLQFMKGKGDSIRKVVKPELVIRQSCPAKRGRNAKGSIPGQNGAITGDKSTSTKHTKDLA